LVSQYQGKYEEAEAINRRAPDGREKVLGEEHPDTLKGFNNLASPLQRQGKYEEAETMIRRALDGCEKALGNDHPETLTNVHYLACLLHEQKRYEAASELYQRASSGYRMILGPSHPTTIACDDHYYSMRQEMDVAGALVKQKSRSWNAFRFDDVRLLGEPDGPTDIGY
jgi:tetratricopeptide (TPR) repeat protein